MKKVVITGAGGFIGGALSVFLADKGIQVYAFSSHAENLKKHVNIAPVQIDIADTEILSSKLREIRPDAIYHLAWQGMTYECKNDIDIQRQNIPLYINLIKAAAGSCDRIIIPGSSSEYAYRGGLIDGSGDFAPGDAYAEIKAELQVSCCSLAEDLGIALTWLLIGSVYGPGRVDNNLVTYAIRALLTGKETEFTGLEQAWDYLYIDDLLRAMYLVGTSDKANKVYAVGSGDVRPLAEYIKIIRDIIDPSAELGIGKLPYKNGRCPDSNIPDIRRLAEDTGYEAVVSFEEGIRKTIEYIKSIEE